MYFEKKSSIINQINYYYFMKKLFTFIILITLLFRIDVITATQTDYTSSILNNDFTGDITKWTRTYFGYTNLPQGSGCMEAYKGDNNGYYVCYQDITVPAGVYQLKAGAFHRGFDNIFTNVILYATVSNKEYFTSVKSLKSETAAYGSTPNSMATAKTAFNAGYWINTVDNIVVPDNGSGNGTLRVGIRTVGQPIRATTYTSGDCWSIWSNFKLYKFDDTHLLTLKNQVVTEANTLLAEPTTYNDGGVLSNEINTLSTTADVDLTLAKIQTLQTAMTTYRDGRLTTATSTNIVDATHVLANPSFENGQDLMLATVNGGYNQPKGWVLTYNSGATHTNNNIDILTNKMVPSGMASAVAVTPTNGTNYLASRFRWTTSESYTISQTINTLKAGKYRLKADFGKYNANGTAVFKGIVNGTAQMTVNAVTSGTTPPTFTAISGDLLLAADNLPVNITATMTQSGATEATMMLDNVQLQYLGNEPSLVVSASTLDKMDELNTQRTFTVTGLFLTSDVILTPPAGFSIVPSTITPSAAASGVLVTVTYDGVTSNATGNITVESTGVTSQNVAVNGVKNSDCFTPLYSAPIANIITDPYFNDIASYAGWGSKSVVTNYVYCGTKSGKIAGKCGGSIDFGLTGKIKANTDYRVKAMVSTNGTGEAKIGIAGLGVTNILQPISTAAGVWAPLDFVFTSGASLTSPNMYFNSCESQTATEGYIDNWEMYAIPKVYASPSALTIYGVGLSKKTALRAENVFSDILITAPAGFTVSNATMPSTVSGSTSDSIAVTFTGPASASGYVYFISGSVKDSLYVSGVADPALATSVPYLSMDELNASGSFTITAANLVTDVTLTAPTGITLSDNTIPAGSANGATISVTYDALANSNGYIVLTSGTAATRVRILARRNDENYTPTYTTLTNLIGDAVINDIANFGGWGNKGINTDTLYVYSGAKSGTFYGGTQCPGSLDKVLTGTLKNSTTYLMKAKVYPIGGGAKIGFYNQGSSDIASPTLNANGTWQNAELTFTTPAALSTNYGVFFNSCWTGAGAGYIDNWELYELPTLSAEGNNSTMDSLIYTSMGMSLNLPITASGFTNGLTITSDNPNFVPTPATLPATGGTVSVQFTGSSSGAGVLTISAIDPMSPVKGLQRVSGSGTSITVPMKATLIPTDINSSKVESLSVFATNTGVSTQFTLIKSTDVELGIYTANGILISKFKQAYQAGSYRKDLNLNLQNGIYLVKLTIDGQSVTKKIVK